MGNQLLLISIVTGAVVAGFVWFTWSLIENIIYLFGRKKEAPSETPPAE